LLNQFINKAAYGYTEKHLGPKEETCLPTGRSATKVALSLPAPRFRQAGPTASEQSGNN